MGLLWIKGEQLYHLHVEEIAANLFSSIQRSDEVRALIKEANNVWERVFKPYLICLEVKYRDASLQYLTDHGTYQAKWRERVRSADVWREFELSKEPNKLWGSNGGRTASRWWIANDSATAQKSMGGRFVHRKQK